MALSSLPKVLWDADPVFFRGDGGELRYYSACVLLSFLGGYALLSWQLRRGGGDVEEAGDFLSYGIPGMLIGARLGHVLFYDFEKFISHPAWALQIWQGGLASHGGVIGLALAMVLFTRRRAIPLLEGTDRLVFSALLGAVLFRIGNLFNSEIVGKPTDGSWGFAFLRRDGDPELLRHPTQIYEALFGLLVLAVLVVADRRWGAEKRARGALTGLALALYFSGRFLIEFLKEPEPPDLLWGLDMAQWLSVPAAVAGFVLLSRCLRKRAAAGWIVSPS